MNKKGFTLIELVVVVAVVAILSAVVIFGFSNFITSAKDAKARETLRNLQMDTILNIGYEQKIVNIDESGLGNFIYLSYDYEKETFSLSKVDSLPDDNITLLEAEEAIFVYFSSLLDESKWSISPDDPTELDTISFDLNSNTLVIHYESAQGGKASWTSKLVLT
jgi:prepilin-type N-terminal cleavage/methylation domain-containing protein